MYNGIVLTSASAPGTTGAAPRPSYPAVYRVVFHTRTHVAAIHPLFYDEALAKVVNSTGAGHGKRVHLAGFRRTSWAS